MQNLWKGFVVGALTGTAVGFVAGWDRAGTSSQGTAPSTRPASRFSRDQVWKGFVIGALTGSGVGLAVDLGARSGHRVARATTHAGHAITHQGPELARQLANSDAATSVGAATKQTAQQVVEAARTAGATAKSAATDAVHTIEDALPDN